MEQMKKAMTLGQLRDVLQRKEPTDRVNFNFGYFRPGTLHSYRGDYSQIAIEYTTDGEPTVASLLSLVEDAIGKTYTGYKGGEYDMHENTPVWVAQHNEACGVAIVDVRDDPYCVRLVCDSID